MAVMYKPGDFTLLKSLLENATEVDIKVMYYLCHGYSKENIVDMFQQTPWLKELCEKEGKHVTKEYVNEIAEVLLEHGYLSKIKGAKPMRYRPDPFFEKVIEELYWGKENVLDACMDVLVREVMEIRKTLNQIVEILNSHKLFYIWHKSLEKAVEYEKMWKKNPYNQILMIVKSNDELQEKARKLLEVVGDPRFCEIIVLLFERVKRKEVPRRVGLPRETVYSFIEEMDKRGLIIKNRSNNYCRVDPELYRVAKEALKLVESGD